MSSKIQKDIDETLNRFVQKGVADHLIPDEMNQPVYLTEDAETGDRILIFSSEEGIEIQLRYEGDNLWISQSQMAELFGRDISSISRHITNILEEGELEEATSLQKMQTTMGGPAILYNLDMIISVGY